MTMSSFSGRPILVTGASGAIGGETVRQLVRQGADEVVAAGRDGVKLAALTAETGVRTVRFDLTSEESVRGALEGLPVWGVVNCGGWGGRRYSPMELDMDVYEKAMAINTRGTLLVTKYASRAMVLADKGGAIVNVSSQASLVALPGHLAYAASKGAVDAITRVCASELGQYNIRVNAVNPTVVMSEMSAPTWGRPEIGGPYLAAMPLGRWATEADIASVIVFLLSDGAAMITGAHVPIDGGYTAR